MAIEERPALPMLPHPHRRGPPLRGHAPRGNSPGLTWERVPPGNGNTGAAAARFCNDGRRPSFASSDVNEGRRQEHSRRDGAVKQPRP